MKLTSLAFFEGESIPAVYTCQGADRSPPLVWENVPAETQSFALIMDDPDAPMGTWDHWVIYNLPPDTVALPENAMIDSPASLGINSWKKTEYGGPCPPKGEPHRYFFRIIALDKTLEFSSAPYKYEVLKAMDGHILDEAILMGYFQIK